jgi:hypothetical protein
MRLRYFFLFSLLVFPFFSSAQTSIILYERDTGDFNSGYTNSTNHNMQTTALRNAVEGRTITLIELEHAETGTTIYGEVIIEENQIAVNTTVSDIQIDDGTYGSYAWYSYTLGVPYVVSSSTIFSIQVECNTCIGGQLLVSGASPSNFNIKVWGYETPLEGCTNISAVNYNSSATVDDGSCVFPIVPVYFSDEIASSSCIVTSSSTDCEFFYRFATSSEALAIDALNKSFQIFVMFTLWLSVFLLVFYLIKNLINPRYDNY